MATVFTQLLQNIEAELKNTQLHPELAEFKFSAKTRHVAPTFLPLLQPVPYFLITPGTMTGSQDQHRTDVQGVNIHIVHGILSHPNHYHTVLGSAKDEGVIDLVEHVAAALWRPKPYTQPPYNEKPFVQLDGVRCTSVVSASEIELTVEPLVTDVFVRQVLSLEYMLEKL